MCLWTLITFASTRRGMKIAMKLPSEAWHVKYSDLWQRINRESLHVLTMLGLWNILPDSSLRAWTLWTHFGLSSGFASLALFLFLWSCLCKVEFRVFLDLFCCRTYWAVLTFAELDKWISCVQNQVLFRSSFCLDVLFCIVFICCRTDWVILALNGIHRQQSKCCIYHALSCVFSSRCAVLLNLFACSRTHWAVLSSESTLQMIKLCACSFIIFLFRGALLLRLCFAVVLTEPF